MMYYTPQNIATALPTAHVVSSAHSMLRMTKPHLYSSSGKHAEHCETV